MWNYYDYYFSVDAADTGLTSVLFLKYYSTEINNIRMAAENNVHQLSKLLHFCFTKFMPQNNLNALIT